MNRRHFIKATGVSFGSLLITTSAGGFPRHSRDEDGIALPDEIVAMSEEASFVLSSSDKRVWHAEDIHVSLSETGSGLGIGIESPAEHLRYLILRWKIQKNALLKVLGDHWERSYGDLRWEAIRSDRVMPWYFLEYDGKVTNGFGIRTGCASMCSWRAGTDGLRLTLDVRSGGSGVALGERTLRAAEIITRKGRENESPFIAAREFCKRMCLSPRLSEDPVYGINDWYFAYGDNSDDRILEHASLMAELAAGNANKPFCVVDAGWAKYSPKRPGDNCWGDEFSACNAKFKDITKLAENIKALGMRPGLWVRPLCASSTDSIARILPPIPGRTDPTMPVLDPTIPENIQKVRSYFRLFRQWGYELIKHDFTTFDLLGKWGFQMMESGNLTSDNWRFQDTSRTNAEIIFALYREIREAAGDTPIIGCNTISHLSAGLFELQRVGDDTSGQEWDRTRKMGVNTLGFRMPQHKTFYAADGDCVGLTTKVPWEKNKQWMQLVAESGTPLFISAQKEAVGAAQREFIRHCFRVASQTQETGQPLDWLENQFPSRWQLLGGEVTFDWS